MFSIDKITGGIFIGAYAALVVVGAFCLYNGIQAFINPNRPVEMYSYDLGLISLGYAFCVALLAYNKFKFSFRFTRMKNDE